VKTTLLVNAIFLTSMVLVLGACPARTGPTKLAGKDPKLVDPATHEVIGVRDKIANRLVFFSGFSVSMTDIPVKRIKDSKALSTAYEAKRAQMNAGPQGKTPHPMDETSPYCWNDSETTADGTTVIYAGCCPPIGMCWSYFSSTSKSGGGSSGGGGGGLGLTRLCEIVHCEED
jgi:hypothetical protein